MSIYALQPSAFVNSPATALPRCRRLVPPCYVPEGDSPLSLYATILSSKVVLASVKEEEEEEEVLFSANAVNEEDPERDRATQV